jgi:hypothetical protein
MRNGDLLNIDSQFNLDLTRPELSAREAAVLILEHAPKDVRDLPVFLLAIAGAAGVNGRLNPMVAGWEVRFELPTPGFQIQAGLYANGNLSFKTQELWSPGSPSFSLAGDWIDSTLAADIAMNEPFPQGMSASNSVSFRMQKVGAFGLFWTVRRTSWHFVTILGHTLSINAASGALVAEAFEQTHNGKIVESRHRSRVDGVGEWVQNTHA